MSNLNSNIIKICILEMSSQNQAILEFFFNNAGKSLFEETSRENAEVFIIDYDFPGAKENVEEIQSTSKMPGIIISIREVSLENTVWIAKPLTSNALIQAKNQVAEMLSSIADAPASAETTALSGKQQEQQETESDDLPVFNDLSFSVNEDKTDAKATEEQTDPLVGSDLSEETTQEVAAIADTSNPDDSVATETISAETPELFSIQDDPDPEPALTNFASLDNSSKDLQQNKIDTFTVNTETITEKAEVNTEINTATNTNNADTPNYFSVQAEPTPAFTESLTLERTEYNNDLAATQTQTIESNNAGSSEYFSDQTDSNTVLGSSTRFDNAEHNQEHDELAVLEKPEQKTEAKDEIDILIEQLIAGGGESAITETTETAEASIDDSAEELSDTGISPVDLEKNKEKLLSIDALINQNGTEIENVIHSDNSDISKQQNSQADVLATADDSANSPDQEELPQELPQLNDNLTENLDTAEEVKQDFDEPNNSVIAPESDTAEPVVDNKEQESEELLESASTVPETQANADESEPQDEAILTIPEVELSEDEELQTLLEEIRKETEGVNSRGMEGANHRHIPTFAEERWALTCGDSNIIPSKEQTYNPADYMLSTLLRVIEQARQTEKVMRMKFNGIIIVILPDLKKIYCDLSIFSSDYAEICFTPFDQESIKIHNLDSSEIRLYRKLIVEEPENSHTIESFLWTSSLLTSRGRLPQGTNTKKSISLKYWPNLTRLEIIPHVMQIAAVFYKYPDSIQQIPVKLNIERRFVNAFYNGVLTLGLLETDNHKILLLSSKNTIKKTQNRGFFTRLLKKIKT